MLTLLSALRNCAFIAITILWSNLVVAQELELGVYGGFQTSPHSPTSFVDAGGREKNFAAGWEGQSFVPPLYWGLRGLLWSETGWGLGAEFTHAKVVADDDTLSKSGFQRLQFTDGINILTANGFRRWGHADIRWAPYLGAGLGISIPHVEVDGNGVSVSEYQLTGPAIRWVGGISYALSNDLSLFSEYNGTYSLNSVDLGAGATLDTKIITNSVNMGISYRF